MIMDVVREIITKLTLSGSVGSEVHAFHVHIFDRILI